MNASSGKTLGIVLIIVLALMAVGVLRFLILVPLGIVDGTLHGFHAPQWDHVGSWIWPWAGFAGLMGLMIIAIWIAVVVWVYKDAEKRGLAGVLWALLVFFTHFIGLIIYVLIRSSHPVRAPSDEHPARPRTAPPACLKCGRPVDRDHSYCPSCGDSLRSVCPKCGKDTQKGWSVCPYCGEKL
jgi:RNA polymerase subunit RPABC4/transcription elongation factor Spt4